MARAVRKRKLGPLELTMAVERYSPGYSLSVPWRRELGERFSEHFGIELSGPVIRPTTLPKVYRSTVVVRIYPDREVSRHAGEPVQAIGHYTVGKEGLACSAFVPWDSFTALLALGRLPYVGLELTYPERGHGSMRRLSLDAEGPDEPGN